MNDEDRLKKIREMFGKHGWGYARKENFEFGYFTAEGALVKKYLKPHSTILIIGSGNGREAFPICRDGHTITCVDKVPIYLESGRLLFKKNGIEGITFREVDVACGLPFPDVSFDFIFFSVFSYLGEDRWYVLKEVRRVIRADGFVLLGGARPIYKKRFPFIDENQYLFFSKIDDVNRAISPYGFRLIEGAVDPLRTEYVFSIIAPE